MLDFVIIVSDGGELKTIGYKELSAADDRPESPGDGRLEYALDAMLNYILDKRAEDAGTYTPADNDTPMIITSGGD